MARYPDLLTNGNAQISHTGIGRTARLHRRTMSRWESGEFQGMVSWKKLKKMKHNILFIHGFGSNKETYKGNKLKELFPEHNWILESFDLLNVEKTIHQIVDIIKENDIDTVVSSSLGCIYNLYLKKIKSLDKPVVNKILINPCCYPSDELPKLAEIPQMALEYCEAMEFNIYHRHEDNHPGNLFGIFAKNDELLHYHDFFVRKYGAPNESNCIWVEGTHAMLSEEVLKDSFMRAMVYFEQVAANKKPEQQQSVQTNLADPNKPYHLVPGSKPVLYFDMDGTLVDFDSGAARLDPITKIKFNGCIDEAPRIFSLMDPIPGAIEAFRKLAEHFDVYILTTASWRNMTACDDKKAWVQRYFGSSGKSPAYKRLIISHRKELNMGEFLIDDRPTKCGADKFTGTVIPFGPQNKLFPDWDSVLRYLLAEK